MGLCQSANSINEKTDASSISVFPNPFKNEFTINGTTEKGIVTILDATGKEVQKQKTFNLETKINTEKLLLGFYLLRYTEGNTTSNSKLIKY